MAAEEHADLSALKHRLGETSGVWDETERYLSQVNALQVKFMAFKASIEGSEEESGKDLDILWRRVETLTTLLTFFKTKARAMVVPYLAQALCGITQLEGVGFVDKDGIPLSSWSKYIDLSSIDSPSDETYTGTSDQAYMCDLVNSVHTVIQVMEALVKRVLIAESETAIEKEKVNFSREEIKKKQTLLESISLKVEEMERFAIGTKCILSEMRQRIEDLVDETSRQRQRAAENEEELSRVKRDFESLKSYVSSLMSVRETLISSEKQLMSLNGQLFERLVAKTSQLEGEKMQKETEVQKLMEENVRLHALVDKKEALLLAMNEQCKMMALNGCSM